MPGASIELILVGCLVTGIVGALASFVIGFSSAVRQRAREDQAALHGAAVLEAPVEAVLAPPDLPSGLRKSREAFALRLERLLRGRTQLDGEAIDAIEELLFGADLGVATALELLEAVRTAASPSEVRGILEARALEILEAGGDLGKAPPATKPRVVLVVGVNGSGKTTTVGKLAWRGRREGRRVLVAAADTFRAAAVDQVAIWTERAGAELVRGEAGGDPAAVAFDAVRSATAGGFDLLLVDTAGRLQTQAGLMDELTKIARVVKKELPDAPHEVLLVLDANTGQNAIRQAQAFAQAVGVTGFVLTKLDGTARGGVVLGIVRETGIPVRYIGLGEGIADLADFDAESFVSALFETRDEAAGS